MLLSMKTLQPLFLIDPLFLFVSALFVRYYTSTSMNGAVAVAGGGIGGGIAQIVVAAAVVAGVVAVATIRITKKQIADLKDHFKTLIPDLYNWNPKLLLSKSSITTKTRPKHR
jgi:hypothetical protein